MFNTKILVLILLLLTANFGRAQTPAGLIDSLRYQLSTGVSDEVYIAHCFTIADSFMELSQYDSAQVWLNCIAEKISVKKPSLANYFLSTRQAEVYYYNGLQRLGLQESERSLSIAQALKDSLLMADSYNFLGLFYINLDSFKKAIPFFLEGIKYSRQPPYPARYLSLSKPHHLYGNMAEAYEKIGRYDSAIHYSRMSLNLATGINWQRGIAIAENGLGVQFLKAGNTDSALHYYSQSLAVSESAGDFDVALINYGGLALTHSVLKNKKLSMHWLEKGFALSREKPFLNDLFFGQFLENAISVYEKYSEKELLSVALKAKAGLLQGQMANNNRQINMILKAGLQNETRLLNLQVKETEQQAEIANTRVYLLISLLVLVVAGFVLYRYKANQKMHIFRLQNKISQDLHDDVGSSLSSLQVYSTVADSLLEKEPLKAREMLKKIAKESAIVLENIGDIVWSMKTRTDQRLNERIKNFVTDVLGAAAIHYTVEIDEGIEGTIKSIEARRNVLLIIKEAVNNTVKYSKASNVSISIKKMAGQLCVMVADNGIGFNAKVPARRGDGLTNMEKRTTELGGIYQIVSSPGKGTTVSALFPITKISETY